MQDYILDHFAEKITLGELSQAALFSPWYAHRLFREQAGISPAEYIRKVRLTEAAKRLKQKKCRVTALAMDLGFGSIDGFTRAFEREFGMTPSAYRLRPVPIAAVQQATDKYDPSVIGYRWDKGNPRIQLEPRGERGYIELKAMKKH